MYEQCSQVLDWLFSNETHGIDFTGSTTMAKDSWKKNMFRNLEALNTEREAAESDVLLMFGDKHGTVIPAHSRILNLNKVPNSCETNNIQIWSSLYSAVLS